MVELRLLRDVGDGAGWGFDADSFRIEKFDWQFWKSKTLELRGSGVLLFADEIGEIGRKGVRGPVSGRPELQHLCPVLALILWDETFLLLVPCARRLGNLAERWPA
jgi:hypothetical protein